jgi:hypothetical protein
MIYSSDSQPGCRGTQECRKDVSGVRRQIRNYCILLMFYYTRCHQIVIFNQLGVPPKFFKDLKGVANQKRLKNTDLQNGSPMNDVIKNHHFFLTKDSVLIKLSPYSNNMFFLEIDSSVTVAEQFMMEGEIHTHTHTHIHTHTYAHTHT